MVVSNNLIGISGKIGNGKDLLFDVINYLAVENDWNSFEHYMHECHITQYENKKFAYPIKWIVSVLIGCDIRQLEDREFKEKELGEEWWYISKPEIGMFIPYTEDNWAAHGDFEENLVMLTPRKFLQLLGTEAGRQIIHPNIWVNALFADYKVTNNCSKHSDGLWYTSEHGEAESEVTPVYPNWIITDVRFPNEANIVKQKGGIMIRVNRGKQCGSCESEFTKGSECPNCRSGNWVYGNIDSTHPSETALDDYDGFDYVIENDGTVQDFIDKVKALNIVQKNS